jgi:hypothetical protein
MFPPTKPKNFIILIITSNGTFYFILQKAAIRTHTIEHGQNHTHTPTLTSLLGIETLMENDRSTDLTYGSVCVFDFQS